MASSSNSALSPALLDASKSFDSFKIDRRLTLAIMNLGWKKPTLVQSAAIPLILDGKDVLARARTGTGKTAAYAIPMLHKILDQKRLDAMSMKSVDAAVRALVLVPTRELVQQVTDVINELKKYSGNSLTVLALQNDGPLSLQRPRLEEKPDIIVSTPGRLLQHIDANHVSLSELIFLVLDESDLLASFGHVADTHRIFSTLPKTVQCAMMSATEGKGVDELKSILNRPVIVKLEDADEEDAGHLSQYYLELENDDKFLFLFAALRFNLFAQPANSGTVSHTHNAVSKTLIFVNETDSLYRLRLFLERLGVKAAVLNAELPANTRYNIVKQFNRGLFNTLLATDEFCLEDALRTNKEADRKKKKKESKKRDGKDKDYGVSRGIDFQDIHTVVNFDVPPNTHSYVHRIGRTSRAGKDGVAVTLIDPHKEAAAMHSIANEMRDIHGAEIVPFPVNMSDVQRFKYRAMAVLRSVTKTAVTGARAAELKLEMLNSKKLKEHFDENPSDLVALKHDSSLAPHKIQSAFTSIPEYLAPKSLQPTALESAIADSFLKSTNFSYKRRKSSKNPDHKDKRRKAGGDPLKSAGSRKRS
nr:ATP-dependent RNA helicase [Seculamonas ecuadoriensis]